MSGNRIFDLSVRLKISGEEGVVLTRAYEQLKGKKAEIGHIVQEIAQEALDAAIVRFTMLDDRTVRE